MSTQSRPTCNWSAGVWSSCRYCIAITINDRYYLRVAHLIVSYCTVLYYTALQGTVRYSVDHCAGAEIQNPSKTALEGQQTNIWHGIPLLSPISSLNETTHPSVCSIPGAPNLLNRTVINPNSLLCDYYSPVAQLPNWSRMRGADVLCNSS